LSASIEAINDVEARTEERNARQDEADDHTRRGKYHDLASANDINILECKEGKEEVGAGDDEADSCRVVESDFLEDCCTVVPVLER
jgi:hypothetical protein